MTIGIVLSKPPKYSETFFNSKIKGLQQSGYKVVLFVQENPDAYNLCKVICAPKVSKNRALQVVLYGYVLLKLLPFFNRVSTFISLEKKRNRSTIQWLKNLYTNAHIITSHVDWLHFGFATMAIQSESVAKTINAKSAVSVRGFDVDVFPIKHPNCYKVLWESTDKLHAISNYTYRKAIASGLSKAVPFQIITPAIDHSKFEVTSDVIRDDFKFVTIARLHWIKGLDYTLEALSLLKKEGVDFQYTIIGEGQELEQLKFAVYQLQLEDRVRFVGQKTPEDVITYLSEASVYIQYSDSEGFCNAVLEAQAMGLLCVVSDADGLKENVIHEKTGIVVPKRQPQLLAKAIKNLLLLPNEMKQHMRTNAQKRVAEQFNLEKQQTEFLEFYE
ncbi:glycosyltransferase family 4 protein [Psychroserpens luteolus]|uniref:glycosyltransferase family 4 protein n=1 Tax=Psychroserpens luteolus TaxID=2855840 RepID=UPI001E5BD14C|nr:glycosyltransferase family 4 protein [Psychroserpens luteolus]MCD2259813.1 glycosyltransferase family 4 protein [Psychroserpens luteolus]